MSRLARSVCGLSAENRSVFDTAVLFLRWHQLAANPLLYRKLCALVSHKITESRLELKPGKMNTLNFKEGVSRLFSPTWELFLLLLSFPSGFWYSMHLKLYLCYIYLYEKLSWALLRLQMSHPGILNVSTYHVPLSSTTILYVHVHHSLFTGTELLSAPVLISSCQTDLYLINTEWHWPASAWQASMDIPVNWDHFGPLFISN